MAFSVLLKRQFFGERGYKAPQVGEEKLQKNKGAPLSYAVACVRAQGPISRGMNVQRLPYKRSQLSHVRTVTGGGHSNQDQSWSEKNSAVYSFLLYIVGSSGLYTVLHDNWEHTVKNTAKKK